jgi:hypothetical protein
MAYHIQLIVLTLVFCFNNIIFIGLCQCRMHHMALQKHHPINEFFISQNLL